MSDSRADALKAAEAYIAETIPTAPPLNARGYPVDGWRMPDPAARLELVLKTARFLLGQDDL